MPELESGWYKVRHRKGQRYWVAEYDKDTDMFSLPDPHDVYGTTVIGSRERLLDNGLEIGPMLMRPNGEIVDHPTLAQHSA